MILTILFVLDIRYVARITPDQLVFGVQTDGIGGEPRNVCKSQSCASSFRI